MVTAMNAQAEDAAKAKALMLMQASRKDVLSREEVTHACARARTRACSRTRTHARARTQARTHARAGAPDEAGGRGNTPTAARAEDSSETLPPPPLTCTRTPCSTPPRPHLGPLLCWHPPATCATPLHCRWLRVSWCCACTLFAPACRARRPRGSQAQQLQQSRTSWRRWASVNVIMPCLHCILPLYHRIEYFL